MPAVQHLLIGGFGVIVVLAALKLFSAPMRWVFKLLFNTALGFAGLLIFNLLSQWLNLNMGLNFNLLNAAVIGILGLPGFALLLLLQWLFGL